MARCNQCRQEMTAESAVSCNGASIEFPDGTKLPPIPYTDPARRCHDCKVKAEGYHHPGCDMERCPKCGGQLIGCGCLDEEDMADFWEEHPDGKIGDE